MTITNEQWNDLFRYCEDIGMFVSDRPINDTENHKGSCLHKTDYCDETCYNVKLYKMYPNMAKRDDRCETIWQAIDRQAMPSFQAFLKRKRKPTKRMRHMSRGEAFSSVADVYRVREMLLAAPDTIFWIPTRAWRNPMLKLMIEQDIMTLPNVAINASFDPSNTKEEWTMMEQSGWNIMFYGDDDLTTSPSSGKRMFLCPKTHKKLKGHCIDCKAGCFAQTTIGRQQIVHLSEH